MGYPSLGGAAVPAKVSHVSHAVESAGTGLALPISARVLQSLQLSAADLGDATLAAAANGTCIGRELVAERRLTEERLTTAMAQALGLGWSRIPDDEAVIAEPNAPSSATLMRTAGCGLEPRLYIAPSLDDLAAIERVLARSAAARARMRLTMPAEIRRRSAMETASERATSARLSLSAEAPALSARQVLTGWQGALLTALAIGLFLSAIHEPLLSLMALHVAFALAFLAPTTLRLAAGLAASAPPPRNEAGTAPGPRPVYSVLVALRGEEEVVADLVGALGALAWPRSKLEVFLVCEADDPGTIAAARAAVAGEPGFEILVVPVSHPRTKPKALNVALPLTTGEFVVLFDAEDRPDRGQLEAAWRAFSAGGETLACLQAELAIANGGESRLSSLFALEYAALFRGVLPWLGRRGLPLPLGGTSNHFRRRHLLAVGGWDSHNVTEDADLGIRLRVARKIKCVGAQVQMRRVHWCRTPFNAPLKRRSALQLSARHPSPRCRSFRPGRCRNPRTSDGSRDGR